MQNKTWDSDATLPFFRRSLFHGSPPSRVSGWRLSGRPRPLLTLPMKFEESTAPTLEEFKAASRCEFTFLLDHGFREVFQPEQKYVNPFEVHFEREGWRLIVEGHSYGFGAGLTVRSPDGREGYFHYLVEDGFWNSHREGLGRGQFGDLKYQRLCLETFGRSFIDGDWREFDTILERHAHWCIENEQSQKKDALERQMKRAIDHAKDLFRGCRFSEAAKLLRPYRDQLPPAQKKRLEIAEHRSSVSAQRMGVGRLSPPEDR